MKKFKNYYLLVPIVVILFSSGCKKEFEKTNNDLTSQANDLQYSMREAQIPIKDAELDSTDHDDENDDDPKIEIHIRDSSYIAITRNDVSTFGNIFDPLDQQEGLVGVIAPPGGCGSLPWLHINTDDENHKNASYTTGWVGNSIYSTGTLDPDRMIVQYCIVDVNLFERRKNEDYAVLNLNNWYYKGISIINTYQDNEDNTNDNQAFESFNPWSIINGQYIFNSFYLTPLYLNRNTRLSFLYFPRLSSGSSSSFPSLPSIGVGYGVFGKFGNKTGNIYDDDEDKNNGNNIAMNLYNDATLNYQISVFDESAYSPFLGVNDLIQQTGGTSAKNANTLYTVSMTY